MAKQLRTPVPSSSIARLFDMQAAATAVAGVTPAPRPQVVAPAGQMPALSAALAADQHPQRQPAPAVPPRKFVDRELVLTPAADETFNRLVDLYRRATGAKVSTSHVARAILCAVAHAMPALEHEARRLGPMKLPSNARDRYVERERFEARLADAFLAGFNGGPTGSPE